MKQNKEKFTKLLQWYKPQSSGSREQVKTGKFEGATRRPRVEDAQRKFVLMVSDIIVRPL